MLINAQNSDLIFNFLSNSQKVTTRALRLSIEQNPERFDREAMGSLLAATGFTFEKLLKLASSYPQLFDFEDNVMKLKAVDNLAEVLGNKYTHSNVFNSNSYKFLTGFVTKYFENYTDEKSGKLNFYVKDEVEYGLKGFTVLVCKSIDLVSTINTPAMTRKIVLDNEIKLENIIQEIKKAFPNYKVEDSRTAHTIKQTIKVAKDRQYEESSFMGSIKKSIDFKDEEFLEYVELSYKDMIVTKPLVYKGCVHHSNDYFLINGLEYISNNKEEVDDAYLGENEELYSYFTEVAKSLNMQDLPLIKENVEKIEGIRNKLNKSKTDDLLATYQSHITNIQNIIFNQISKGLAESFSNAENNIEICRPVWNTMRIKSLKKKWDLIEEGLYTRNVDL